MYISPGSVNDPWFLSVKIIVEIQYWTFLVISMKSASQNGYMILNPLDRPFKFLYLQLKRGMCEYLLNLYVSFRMATHQKQKPLRR